MKPRIGIMGSAQGPNIRNQENVNKAITIGQQIAKSGCILVTGACPGLPDDAAFGAKFAGGMTLGISPAFSEEEHTKLYKSPHENYDIVIYTGFGLMVRDIVNIRSSDAIIIVGGGVGTLNEFTVAFDDQKVIGVLTGTGGISDHIDEILEKCDRQPEEYVLFDSDPVMLVRKVLSRLKHNPRPFTEDQRVIDSGKGE